MGTIITANGLAMHSNFNDLRTEIMTAKEIIIKNKELFEQEPYKEMYNGDVNAIEKCMEEYHQAKLKLLGIAGVSGSAYICQNVNGEEAIVFAENIAGVFDKLEEICPDSSDVKVAGKSTPHYR